ncbi:helix-turn-helix domain-containing protein [Clostridium botulinum]|uniref:AraC family transcriptional regulator n=1 Tax=Clostridium botulinum B str. Osaka05 TaxID=1407017 RepID=A0A0S6U1M8_CLOBO|nr:MULTISPECIES: AraC family transcriptional regulator [Clostridium]EJE7233848.1 helix-turn-helix domain-containing protein [Clostridium botulinum]EKO1913248.1 helix-turn-helix domain-containing protein [Clostridium botulinum]EKO2043310.1 helix-turn-helix domain-containing protein [Clostridium botulinum]MCW6109323.1 AraC family transcriptional regulator [Clostridium sporogenes]GAE01060.1 AraC family transcriptional regulator [Clostridium botulinum B str. Osaka05]
MDIKNSSSNIKRGYLKEDFRFFHLKDKKDMEFRLHYHDFNKIIVFISGNVSYLIEGKAYKLKPWDILFVSSNDLHKVIINNDEPYERIIIWVNSKFLEMHNKNNSNLLTCFQLSSKLKINLFRMEEHNISLIKHTLFSLESATKDKEFGNIVLKNSLFIQLMVYLNRLFMNNTNHIEKNDIEYDKQIEEIINYIKENLQEDLCIDTLSSKFFINKYYLMHKFKSQTGYTLHKYIQQKRLAFSKSLIIKGHKITELYIKCGFGDYSSFIRAFKKAYGISPKDYYKNFKNY